MKSQKHFPWDDLMKLGLGRLRLSSEEFWAMTPRELDLAARGRLGLPASLPPPARRDLLQLMRRYPD